jgi:hypothetical protein
MEPAGLSWDSVPDKQVFLAANLSWQHSFSFCKPCLKHWGVLQWERGYCPFSDVAAAAGAVAATFLYSALA